MVNPSRSILVNNTNSLIIYEPANAWTGVSSSEPAFQVGNLGSPFSSTLKSTFQDSSFSFSFNGSSIKAFGSGDILSGERPIVSCTIDGVVIKPNVTDFPQNNWAFCVSGDLDVGQHVLEVDVESQGSPFFFDYFMFVPASDDQLKDGLIHIDPSDPSIIYFGNWTSQAATAPAQLTNDNGSFVTISFIGQQLTWYGVFSTLFPFSSAFAEYSVDGGSPIPFELAGLVDAGPFTASLINLPFFQTGNLSNGAHEVTVTYLGNEQQTDLGLGFVIIQNSSETAVVSNTTTSFTPPAFTRTHIRSTSSSPQTVTSNISSSTQAFLSSPSSSSPSTTVPQSHTPSSDSATSTVIKPTSSTGSAIISGQSHSSRVQMITIGTVIGAALLLVITLTGIFLYKRRRRNPVKRTMSENTTPTLPLASAFTDSDSNLNTAFLRRQRTMRTTTSDSLDGYATPSIVSSSASAMDFCDSTNGLLFNLQGTRVASPPLHVPSLPTLLDPFVFDDESSSFAASSKLSDPPRRVQNTNTMHSIRLIRPLPHHSLAPDVEQTADIGGTVRLSGLKAERDSGIRLGKDQVLHYEGASSLKGTPPIYTRI